MNISFLADHPECRPILTEWFLCEWPDLFNERFTPSQELDNCQNRDSINCMLLGFIDDRLVASAALLNEDALPLPEYSPWLGTVVVAPDLRGKGLGREIVISTMKHAQRLGLTTLHLWTPQHRYFYEKLGWQFVRKYLFKDYAVSILRISFPQNLVHAL